MPNKNASRQTIVRAIVIIWCGFIATIGVLRYLDILTILDPRLERLWWIGLLLLGAMFVGLLYQPSLKEHMRVHAQGQKGYGELQLMAWNYLVAFVLFGIFGILLLRSGLHFPVPTHIPPVFWVAALGTGVLNLLLFYFSNKALRYGDLSLVSTAHGLSPLFAFLFAFPIFYFWGEATNVLPPSISFLGGVGMILSIGGFLYGTRGNTVHTSREAPPSGDYFSHHPMMAASLAAFFASISLNFDKIAVETGGPYLLGLVMLGTVGALATLVSMFQIGFPSFLSLWKLHWKAYIKMGGIYAVIILIMNIALFGQNLAYYAVIKRISIVLAALYGLYVLREGVDHRDRSIRIAMSIIVFIGIALIAIGG